MWCSWFCLFHVLLFANLFVLTLLHKSGSISLHVMWRYTHPAQLDEWGAPLHNLEKLVGVVEQGRWAAPHKPEATGWNVGQPPSTTNTTNSAIYLCRKGYHYQVVMSLVKVTSNDGNNLPLFRPLRNPQTVPSSSSTRNVADVRSEAYNKRIQAVWLRITSVELPQLIIVFFHKHTQKVSAFTPPFSQCTQHSNTTENNRLKFNRKEKPCKQDNKTIEHNPHTFDQKE